MSMNESLRIQNFFLEKFKWVCNGKLKSYMWKRKKKFNTKIVVFYFGARHWFEKFTDKLYMQIRLDLHFQAYL